MRIQWKVTLLVLLTLVGTLSAVAWKTRAVLTKDKLSFIADSSMKQIAPLKRLVQERLDDHKSRLVKFAAGRSTAAAPNAGRSRAFGDFEVVALMQPQATPGSEATQWQPGWVEKSPVAKADQWPAGFDLTLLKSLPYARVKDGETIWARVSDRQGSPVYAILVSVEIQNNANSGLAAGSASDALPDSTDYKGPTGGAGRRAIIVGFSTLDPVANVTEDYIGSTNVVYLVDDKGYVASHVNKAYLGALFTEDPIVQEIVKAHKTAATGNYEDLESRPVTAHFERVDRTNLFAIITSPLDAVTDSVNAQVMLALQVGGAIGVIGLILAWLLGRSISGPIEEASAAIRSLNRGEPHVIRPINSGDEVGTLMRLLAESTPTALKSKTGWNQEKGQEPTNTGHTLTNSRVTEIDLANTSRLAEERRAAYEVFNDGFAKAIQEPLMAIIGHAQLSKSKSEDPELRSHAESIERESRRAQDVLERLENWTHGALKVEGDETIDLKTVIAEAIQAASADLKLDGVQVTEELHSVPRFHGSADLMKSALGHLIDNAREAMAARPEKNLRIQLDYLSDCIYLVISDSGVGMTRDVKDKAFDPFFKGFQSPKRLGLGLSFVQTTLKSLGGTAEIESAVGEGASVTLKLPVSVEEKEAFRNEESSKLADANAVRFGAPPEILKSGSPKPAVSPPPRVAAPAVPPAEPVAASPMPTFAAAASAPAGTPSNAVTSSLLSSLLNAAAQPRVSRNSAVGIPIPPPTLAPLPPEPEPIVPPPAATPEISLEGHPLFAALTTPLGSTAKPVATPAAKVSGNPPPLFELEMPPLLPALDFQADVPSTDTDGDGDDDGDEMFANIPLSNVSFGQPMAKAPEPAAPELPAPPSRPPEPAREFEVKIRRPRVRS